MRSNFEEEHENRMNEKNELMGSSNKYHENEILNLQDAIIDLQEDIKDIKSHIRVVSFKVDNVVLDIEDKLKQEDLLNKFNIFFEKADQIDYVQSAVKKIYKLQNNFNDQKKGTDINWERKYYELINSKRYKIGTWLVEIIKNPIGLYKRIIQVGTKNISIKKKRKQAIDLREIKVALIVDEFTEFAFKSSFNTCFLSQKNWNKELYKFTPDILFIESCWRGNNNSWGRLTVKSNGIKKLSPLIAYCKKNNIPTVFWNKEDPFHYYVHNQNKFGEIANMFDYIFTTDADMIPRYKKDFNRDVDLLPFFCVSNINKEDKKQYKIKAVIFAGSYYKDKPQRCRDFDELIDAIVEVGLEYKIYDRNYGTENDNLIFPEPYSSNVIESLKPDEMQLAYTRYKYQLNINTVTHSSTMFARRVFESLASGTPIISNYSKGIDLMFGDIVIMGRTKEELVEKLFYYENNPLAYEKIRQEGMDRCHKLHNLEKRMYQICHTCNIPLIEKNINILNIVIYADVDLNYIDGSSIWLISIVKKFAEQSNIDLTVLLKSNSEKSKIIDEIKNIKNVKLIYPETFNHKNRLNEHTSLEMLEKIVTSNTDYVIVRGYKICKKILEKGLFKNILIPYILEEIAANKHTEDDCENIIRISAHSAFMLVQSQTMRDKYINNFGLDAKKLLIFPPIIYNYQYNPSHININNSIVYTGKFSKLWFTEELIELFDLIKKEDNTIILNIAGSVFRTDLNNIQDLKNRFEEDEHICYFGGISREKSLEMISQSDIGFALRSSEIDNDQSNEVSTKLLEYMSLGKPVLLRRTKIHENLLGENYYLFADDIKEAAQKCIQILQDSQLYERESRKCYECYKKYVSQNWHERAIAILKEKTNYQKTILFAGHDFKFLQKIIDAIKYDGNYKILIDKWNGHNVHNEEKSKQLLEQTDIIFCEWGLGNAVWYSNNKKKYQKLIVRMHLQERDTIFPEKFCVGNINKFIFISPYIYDVFQNLYHFPEEKTEMIYNYVDTDYYNKEKIAGYEYNIGIVGIVPQRKRLDRALDIIEKIHQINPQYKLYIKGKLPEEYPWMLKRKNELEYYNNQYNRIKTKLSNCVFFDEYKTDMSEWFTKIGYILSVSDFESFHLTPAEGMASGASPAVLNWDGAETIHPPQYIKNSVDDIVQLILNTPADIEENKKYVQQRFDLPIIYRKIMYILKEI